MLWHKEIVSVTVTAGTGAANSGRMRGMIEQVIVVPRNSSGAEVSGSDWSLSISDKDNDVLRLYQSETGRMEDIKNIPVGTDKSEKLTLAFTSISGTVATMRAVFKIRETVQ
jgi:hypothetical protein